MIKVSGLHRGFERLATMRVLRVVTLASRNGRYGGPFDTARLQVQILQGSGVDATLLSGYLEADEPEETKSIGSIFIKVRRLFPSPGFTSHFSGRMLKSLSSEIRKSDIVHISLAREAVPLSALFLARLFRRHTVIQSHGMLTSRSSISHKVFDLFLRPLIREGCTWITLTPAETREIKVWSKRKRLKYVELGNPADVNPEEVERMRRKEREPEALFLARLHPRKRVDDFIAAAEIAARNGWQEKYVVVGPDQGCLSTVFEAEAKLPNLTYEGTLPGSEVSERLSSAAVFVLPSENEPWGNVLALSLLLHTPVVVTVSAALSSAVVESGAGFTVDERNPEQIAAIVHKIIHEGFRYPDTTKEIVPSRSSILETLTNAYLGAGE